MVKTASRAEIPQLVLIAAMFVASALAWPFVGDRIPAHWNSSGEVDRYGGKIELFLVPAIALGLYLLLRFLPRIDPGQASYAAFAGAYTVIRVSMVVFMAVVHAVMIYTAIDTESADLNVTRLVMVGVGLLFVVMGLVLGKVQPNWFVGIRTPWTLSSRRSWAKTHRLGGWLFILMGLAMIVAGFVTASLIMPLILVTTLGGTAIMVIYSYVEWRRDPDKLPPGTRLPG